MKSSNLLLNLCLTSLVVTVSMVGTTNASHSRTNVSEKSTFQIAGNPCASSNPCASANPCAGKLGSVGGPLAQQLQGKPVVVDVYATWCAGCKNIESTLSQLKKQYSGDVHFVVFDVSDKAAAKASEAKAKQLGLEKFFKAYKSKTSTVAIIDPATGNILAMEKNNPNKSAYTTVLESQLAKK